MTALLDIAGLSVNFPVSGGLFDTFIPGRKRYIDILDGISLSLKSGETLGLVGEPAPFWACHPSAPAPLPSTARNCAQNSPSPTCDGHRP
jgi:hypothetical protein